MKKEAKLEISVDFLYILFNCSCKSSTLIIFYQLAEDNFNLFHHALLTQTLSGFKVSPKRS